MKATCNAKYHNFFYMKNNSSILTIFSKFLTFPRTCISLHFDIVTVR